MPMIDSQRVNDIQNWRFCGLPAIFGENYIAFNVKTEEELDKAMRAAKHETHKLVFIELSFSCGDCSPALQALSDRVKSIKR
jgi:TPP-dependent 2-oxoacid decarboxylase